MEKNLTCIMCPIGCSIIVKEKNGEITVYNNACKRGEVFGKEEVTSPKRIVTTTVLYRINSKEHLLPVISTDTVPKSKFRDVIKELQNIEVTKEVIMGDVIIKNVLELGVDIVASKTIRE